MSFSHLTKGALLAGLVATLSCEGTGAVQGPRLPPGATPPAAMAAPPVTVANPALYRRLGEERGIRAVATDFVGRAARDTRINGYFLNRSSASAQRLIDCLVLQLSQLTGGPQAYAASGCRDMKTVHRGLGISTTDFNDTAAHLVSALTAARVSAADISTIVAVLNTTIPDIVEDAGNNKTVYQRIGRRPAIEQVVVTLMRDIYNDPRIIGFFQSGNAARLQTCLVRMVCGIDGPCRYGDEVDNLESGVSQANPCKDMVTVHKDIRAPRAITIDDFNIVAQLLAGVLDRGGVSAADKNAILAALGPTCRQIVPGGTGCSN